MTATDLAAAAVFVVNLWAAASGAAAVRAWWPRQPLSCEPRSTQVFYFAILGLMIAFAGNAALKVIDLIQVWPPAFTLANVDDLIWRSAGGACCFCMVWSKLLALPPVERARWNVLTVIAHPDADSILVRTYNAVAGRMRRRSMKG